MCPLHGCVSLSAHFDNCEFFLCGTLHVPPVEAVCETRRSLPALPVAYPRLCALFRHSNCPLCTARCTTMKQPPNATVPWADLRGQEETTARINHMVYMEESKKPTTGEETNETNPGASAQSTVWRNTDWTHTLILAQSALAKQQFAKTHQAYAFCVTCSPYPRDTQHFTHTHTHPQTRIHRSGCWSTTD